MKQLFTELFEYNHHCNQKLADVFLQNQEKTSDKAISLFNHILNAHRIWNTRIEPKHEHFGVWQIHDLADLKNIDKTNFGHSLQIIDTFDFTERISYTNSKGQHFTKGIRDILFHIINHSTYHRGQIVMANKSHGIEPLITDFIFYKP